MDASVFSVIFNDFCIVSVTVLYLGGRFFRDTMYIWRLPGPPISLP